MRVKFLSLLFGLSFVFASCDKAEDAAKKITDEMDDQGEVDISEFENTVTEDDFVSKGENASGLFDEFGNKISGFEEVSNVVYPLQNFMGADVGSGDMENPDFSKAYGSCAEAFTSIRKMYTSQKKSLDDLLKQLSGPSSAEGTENTSFEKIEESGSAVAYKIKPKSESAALKVDGLIKGMANDHILVIKYKMNMTVDFSSLPDSQAFEDNETPDLSSMKMEVKNKMLIKADLTSKIIDFVSKGSSISNGKLQTWDVASTVKAGEMPSVSFRSLVLGERSEKTTIKMTITLKSDDVLELEGQGTSGSESYTHKSILTNTADGTCSIKSSIN